MFAMSGRKTLGGWVASVMLMPSALIGAAGTSDGLAPNTTAVAVASSPLWPAPSPTNPAGYDVEEAKKFVQIQAQILCNTPGPGVTDAKWVEGANNLALVGRFESNCIVAFRGTHNSANRWQDMSSSWLWPFPDHDCAGCKVGYGIEKAYAGVSQGVKAALRELSCEKVHLSGHSLGAALAIVALYDLSKSGYTMLTSFTFGEPRVGNQAWHDAWESALRGVPVYRLVHGLDPIVNLGPKGSPTHEGEEVYEEGNDKKNDHHCYLNIRIKAPQQGQPTCGGPCYDMGGEQLLV